MNGRKCKYKMKKLINLAKIALIPLLTFGLQERFGSYNGHGVEIGYNERKAHKYMIVYSKQDDSGNSFILAIDKDCDGKFDEKHHFFYKGDELKKYVSLDSLNKIQGCVLNEEDKQ